MTALPLPTVLPIPDAMPLPAAMPRLTALPLPDGIPRLTALPLPAVMLVPTPAPVTPMRSGTPAAVASP